MRTPYGLPLLAAGSVMVPTTVAPATASAAPPSPPGIASSSPQPAAAIDIHTVTTVSDRKRIAASYARQPAATAGTLERHPQGGAHGQHHEGHPGLAGVVLLVVAAKAEQAVDDPCGIGR